MKYAPRKVYIKENNVYVELSYKDFCRRRKADQSYMDKLFIPVQGCLLEVVREQYTDFYRDKERWRYLKKLDTNHGKSDIFFKIFLKSSARISLPPEIQFQLSNLRTAARQLFSFAVVRQFFKLFH